MKAPVLVFVLWLLMLPLSTFGSELRCIGYSETRQPFFGDLHIHTKYSLDASTQATRTTPDQVYSFAKGEKLGIQPWYDDKPQRFLQLSRPLDFAMVSDHAELLGETHLCSTQGVPQYEAWQCTMYRDWPRAAFYWFNYWSAQHAERVGFCDDGSCKQAALSPWQDIQNAAEKHYDRSEQCRFTTFVGYEWTGGGAGKAKGNTHRNIVFRGSRVPELPHSFIDDPTAEGLYKSLNTTCRNRADCDALVIPHNSNLSAGLMFQAAASGEAAALRASYETLAEIVQHKGSSECYFNPLGQTDELCAFEQLPQRSWSDNQPPQPGDGFLREVLKEGLELEQSLGTNPFRFGFIGSTDTHLGAAGAISESGFPGHGGAGIPAGEEVPPGLPDLLEYSPGGMAVLWAEENTRESLFKAMQRREAYATSGPRILTRFFGGSKLPRDMCQSKNFAQTGYELGVPMGAQLDSSEGQSAPRFAVLAAKDADSHGIERIQIIKGWLDEDGARQEAVYDVVESANQATIDEDTCVVSGSSAAELCGVWEDPEFNPDELAYYYSRVLESPRCRWSQQICVARGVDCDNPDTITEGLENCCVASHRKVIRERAWASPVWYRPSGD